MKPRTLILRTAGTNCDLETAHAFELAGAECERVHVNRLIEQPTVLERFQLLAIPGGFSYGDDIAAGRIFANQLVNHLREPMRRFVESGKAVIGICNGFQVLVKTDLLPGPLGERAGQTCTLTHNDCGRFVDRWVFLAATGSRCIWTRTLDRSRPIELPVAHGEGKFVCADEFVREALWANHRVALVYARPDGSPAGGHEPFNPNGSVDDIAGVCDETGLVLGLMPHPERHVDALQHYAWSRRPSDAARQGDGLALFRAAVEHARGI